MKKRLKKKIEIGAPKKIPTEKKIKFEPKIGGKTPKTKKGLYGFLKFFVLMTVAV